MLSTNRPELRWELPANADGAKVVICGDARCYEQLAVLTATGTSVSVTAPLPAGPVFWFAHSLHRGSVNSDASPTWVAFVPNRTAAPSTALGTRLDVNRDGFCDFLLDDRVLFGSDVGYVGSTPLPPAAPGTIRVYGYVGDINGDGLTDLMRLDTPDTFPVLTPTALLSRGDGFTEGVPDTSVSLSGSLAAATAAGDVNADGYADILIKARFGVVSYLGGAAALSVGPSPHEDSTQSGFAFGGDLNGDRFSDAASTSNGGGRIVVTPGSASGFATDFQAVPIDELGFPSGTMMNANGDGYSDFAFTSEADFGVLVLLPGGAGGLSATPFQVIPPTRVGGFLDPAGSGDFNGDGRPDLVTVDRALPQEEQSQSVRIHNGTASGFDPTGSPLALPLAADVHAGRGAFSDVNGDGFDDLTVTLLADPAPSGPLQAIGALLFLGSPAGLIPAPPPATP